MIELLGVEHVVGLAVWLFIIGVPIAFVGVLSGWFERRRRK